MTTLFLEPTLQCAHLSITNNLYDTRRELGLTVTSARLPPSVPRWTIRHYLRSSPVGLGTSTRLAQAADSLHSVVLHHGDQVSTDQKRVLRPAGRTSELGSRHTPEFAIPFFDERKTRVDVSNHKHFFLDNHPSKKRSMLAGIPYLTLLR